MRVWWHVCSNVRHRPTLSTYFYLPEFLLSMQNTIIYLSMRQADHRSASPTVNNEILIGLIHCSVTVRIASCMWHLYIRYHCAQRRRQENSSGGQALAWGPTLPLPPPFLPSSTPPLPLFSPPLQYLSLPFPSPLVPSPPLEVGPLKSR